MKKLINDVQDVLNEQLAGLAKAHPSLKLHQDPVYVTRADAPVAGKVALLSGGASGPLFGTFFIRAAQVTQAHHSLTLEELYQMFRDGADGVVSRGKAEPGDKTMCDVWGPVVESLRLSTEQNISVPTALEAASRIAESAAQSTITMQARKGRASYLGERSVGHQDPGATSVMFMMQMLALAAKE